VTTHTSQALDTPRIVGACGILAGALIVAAPMVESPIGTAGWIAGIALLLPFLSGLAAVLAADAGSTRWLAPVMSAGAAIAVALHLVTLGVAHVAGSVSKDSAVHEPLHAVESALFGISLLPLGLAVAAAAIAMIRHGRLPRWLGYPTGVVSIALFANGGQVGTEEVPGLLLFMLWTLVIAVILVVRRRAAAPVTEPAPVAAGIG
jgi:hypothetical protein